MTLPEIKARPMRRDAQRNQKLVLDAARDVLSEHGPDASMDLVAARAGVGIGTLYRNFPTKDALIDELVRIIFDDLVAAATDACAQHDGRGLEVFLRHLGTSLVRHRRYAAMLVGHTHAVQGTQRVRQLVAELTGQATAVGTLGDWVSVGDVMALIWALRGVIETSGDVVSGAWERFLELHLTALRTPVNPSGCAQLSGSELADIAAARSSQPR